ncbi:MAG: SDR family NAD(P)-dependent oxidoreductase, partial [Phycisphaeraceae bacterium]|nr:SDR family NAD(P)-dependent oxidoreductase [Phycisphaeraceae bacterium]
MSTAIRPLAVVTGASSGIGRVLCHRLDRRGYRLMLVSRTEADLQAVADQVTEAQVVPADLAQPEGPATVSEALDRDGAHVEVLINNAGFGHYATVLDHEPELVEALMHVHYFSPLKLIQRCVPGMVANDKGHVINTASIAARIGP